MPESLLDRAARVAGRVAPYAVVPALLTLLAFDNVAATAASDGGLSVSVKFALPTAVPTLWTVFDPPTTGVSFVTPTRLSALPVYLVVDAVLTAGYLGGIHDAAHDVQPDFVENVATYALPVLGVRVVEFLTVGLFSFLLVAGGNILLAFVAFPLVLFAGYLLWGAPFLVVARDRGVVDALVESVALALDGGHYLYFSVLFAVGVAVVSLFVSPVLAAGGFGAIVVMAAVIAYPALVASAAALLVVDEVADQPTRDQRAPDQPAPGNDDQSRGA
ncbi:hypothetical protein [Halobacterium noricense]|uniref:hypothetical protein n=1 Tax=Halobacterium noricense TaxID=223182 RepID=UPI001E47FA37|nr:hypothetical protein [Halobacterium noricense]UHH26237.1 hypothetical protein LT974_04700 [Halobacterium noricense]